MASAVVNAGGARGGFIATPAFDLLFFILAPWLCLAFGVGMLRVPWSNEPAVFMAGDRTRYALFVAVWIYGHLAAVVFRSHLNASIFKKHPLRFTLVPIALYFAMALSRTAFLIGVLLASLWDAYHTSMQNFGLARIYDAKAGNPPKAGRTLDIWLAHSSYIAPLIFGLSFIPTIEDLDKFQAVGWLWPSQLLHWLDANHASLGRATAILAAAFVAYYVWSYWQMARAGHRISRQKVGLLVSTALVTILAFGFLDAFRGYAITSLYHGLQYFGIVWWTERKNLGGRLGFSSGKALPLAALFVVSIALAGLGYEAALQLGVREASVTAGAFWIFPIPFVVSLMHFWYDGFVWSVQRKEV